jgi:hypothetical protein
MASLFLEIVFNPISQYDKCFSRKQHRNNSAGYRIDACYKIKNMRESDTQQNKQGPEKASFDFFCYIIHDFSPYL